MASFPCSSSQVGTCQRKAFNLQIFSEPLVYNKEVEITHCKWYVVFPKVIGTNKFPNPSFCAIYIGLRNQERYVSWLSR